jgi:GxxExxY protein
MKLVHEELRSRILKCAYAVHTELGPGLLEPAYEECLEIELQDNGLFVQRQFEFPLVYKGKTTKKSYRIDLLVENKVVIELKAVDTMLPIFEAVTINYMRLQKCPVGYLINFNVISLKDGIKTFYNHI